MRLNRFVAAASGLSRRAADQAISDGRVAVDGQPAALGQQVAAETVTLDGQTLTLPAARTIVFYKPVGSVTSRIKQGNVPTIYSLLPSELASLKSIGRLDKNSSGVLLLTNNGELAHQLTHPGTGKLKRYRVVLNKPLRPADAEQLRAGVPLDDGPSSLELSGQGTQWNVDLREGRNRQIRRSFEALGYTVVTLHRYEFAGITLGDLQPGQWREAGL